MERLLRDLAIFAAVAALGGAVSTWHAIYIAKRFDRVLGQPADAFALELFAMAMILFLVTVTAFGTAVLSRRGAHMPPIRSSLVSVAAGASVFLVPYAVAHGM